MPRRSTIPVPGLAQVSHAGPMARMDPGAAAAPGRAATSMVQTGLNVAAGLTQQHIEAKETAAWNRYESQRNIFNMEQSTKDKMAWDAFNNSAKTADPSEILGMYEDMVKLRDAERSAAFAKLQGANVGLSKRATERMNLELSEIQQAQVIKQKAGEEAAILIQDGRTFDVETRAIELSLSNLYGDEKTPGVSEDIKALEERYAQHYESKTEVNIRLSKIRATATYKGLIGEVDGAVNETDLLEIDKKLKGQAKVLDAGHEHSINNAIKGKRKNIAAYHGRLERSAAKGDLDRDEANMALDKKEISPEFHQRLITLDSSADNDIRDDQAYNFWVKTTWPDAHETLKDMLGTDADNIEILNKTLREVDRFIRKTANTERERQHMQGIALGYIKRGTSEEDNTWFSRHAGDLLSALPEDRQEDARVAFNNGVTDMQKTLEESGSLISIDGAVTTLEEKIANLYSLKGDVSPDEIKKATAESRHVLGAEITKASIRKDKPPRPGLISLSRNLPFGGPDLYGSPKEKPAVNQDIPQAFLDAGGTASQWELVEDKEVWR